MWYQKAAQMDPHYTQAYNDIGVIYEHQGEIDLAEEMYKKTLEIDPSHVLSADPGELKLIVKEIRSIEKALGHPEKKLTENEQKNMDFLRKRFNHRKKGVSAC